MTERGRAERDDGTCFWCGGDWRDGYEHDFCDFGQLRPWEPKHVLRLRTSKRHRASVAQLPEFLGGKGASK